ncbi:hypothetical protein R6Q59_008907 [Mikania micrantha]|uniref:RING-type domain-containing protein n=1 Tax=Mikania micrantha TaxID=192012 RepID=A0A5N6L938_9ASTR|nr:hypothetical protein E3N88_45475 [Mikania micrantha]
MEVNLLALKLISLVVTVSLVAIIVNWCNRRQNRIPPIHVQQRSHHRDNNNSLENSMVLLIPTHKHQKGSGSGSDAKGGDGDTDVMCSICLCEFKEDEVLRTLPECLHSFHVPCIDMWLYSNSTCPICRVDALSSSQKFFQVLNSDSNIDVRQESSNIVQISSA